MNWGKAILLLYLVLFAAVAGWAGLFFLGMHRDYTALRAQEEVNRRRLTEAKAKLEQQERYLARLRTDPALVEQVVRRKLGYVRSDEFVFRFEDPRQP